jgi:hypothetical protein
MRQVEALNVKLDALVQKRELGVTANVMLYLI